MRGDTGKKEKGISILSHNLTNITGIVFESQVFFQLAYS